MPFRDRHDAGQKLAELLHGYRGERPVVLALSPGGTVCAFEVARALGASLDVLPDPRAEARPDPDLAGRTVILVDDGIASGTTARTAVQALSRLGPARVVLAAPVAAAETIDALGHAVDDAVCVETPVDLYTVGLWYAEFDPVTIEEARALVEAQANALRDAEAQRMSSPRLERRPERQVMIHAGSATLPGDLAIVGGARGLILFAHGSGSSRRSPRNRRVAAALQREGFATLLIDLLTEDEEQVDAITAEFRFDIDLLAERLAAVAGWLQRDPATRHLPIGLFGASTGAAAALVAAARRPDAICAVVSRGGRPDLAGPLLHRVRAPVLLIVGGADTAVLGENYDAHRSLGGEKGRLAIVPGASHLFEERGALEEVARLAVGWFAGHMGGEVGVHA